MTNNTASLEYRRAATQQASVVGLVIALHDTLMGDIRRAAEAIDKGDIQGRCDQLVHAFKVLQQLEAMLDMDKGGITANQVKRFYAHIRGQMLLAQFKLSSAILHQQIQIVLEVREAWQQLDSSTMERRNPAPLSSTVDQAATERAEPAEARLSFSCSF
ncbi:flagellar protein FliS [Granulicella aggregans]|jgi:flagellar protein FliS|uniref:Flagellar protein FliS n=1 Tax=Granulicella aggregans TaxID=474949 RepID=A0A7W7ZAM8_9BACT|nr:flagellar export chaperone FliS [Granulicella aggregans]MBB5056370.1 flagellar protein FliS [Granulicella aggregans]